MTPKVIAFALAATAASGVAWADKPVRTSATVEVLDDKAQIDDVISRMREQQQKADAHKQQGDKGGGAGDGSALRDDRPSATLGATDTHRTVAPEAKSQPPGSRRVLQDLHNFERAERPRPKKK